MPTYQYRCTNEDCKYEFEVVQRITEDALTTCPECTKQLKKVINTQGGFQLKGSGWFDSGGY